MDIDENEQMTQPSVEEKKRKPNKILGFFADVLKGIAIGIAFIIPGFSGGSVAAILGIYERLIEAISGIAKHFKQSVMTLIPIILGMLAGIAALIWPIQWGLEHYPIPTVTLFVGLAIGGLPSITDRMKGGESWTAPKWTHILACIIPLALTACISFIPTAGDVELFNMQWWGYIVLVLIGIVGAAALVVPGISGSMLLLIFGYYNPLVRVVTDNLLHGQNIGLSIAIIGCFGVGIIIGFFGISVIMKVLLKKFPRGTYFSIFGFIIGSLPVIYISTAKEADLTLQTLPTSPWYWIVAVLMLIAGIVCSYMLVRYARKKSAQVTAQDEACDSEAVESEINDEK